MTGARANRCCAARPAGAKGSEPAGCGRGAQAMLLVTGGAGFIGSNVVASLNEAGRADVVVNDRLGCDEKWRNLGKRELADFIPPEDLLPWLAGRTLDAVIHLGADLRHHRARRGPRRRHQFPPVAASARLVRADADAVHLCVLGGDLWRRLGRLRGRRGLARAAPVAAAQSLRLEQASVRSRRHRACAPRRADAAAMGRPQILQRVRAERVPQRRDDEPDRQALPGCARRPNGAPVQVAPARHRRRRSAPRFHLCGGRRRSAVLVPRIPPASPACSMSARERRAASAT